MRNSSSNYRPQSTIQELYSVISHSLLLEETITERKVLDVWCKFYTVYPKKYAHVFCFAVLCCGYTLTDFPISIRLTSLALWQSNDCPSARKATLMNMDKYFMWIHYERLHNHNKAKHNKTVCIFLGIYCKWNSLVSHFQFHKIWTATEQNRVLCIIVNIYKKNLSTFALRLHQAIIEIS